jgi:hypothetical protein
VWVESIGKREKAIEFGLRPGGAPRPLFTGPGDAPCCETGSWVPGLVQPGAHVLPEVVGREVLDAQHDGVGGEGPGAELVAEAGGVSVYGEGR